MIEIISDYKLLLIAALTSLAVEGIKKILKDMNKTFSSNVLAIIVSIVLSIIICISDAVFRDIAFDMEFIWRTIDIIILSAIIAMVGYDKFKQAIIQIQTMREGGKSNEDSERIE